MNDRFDIYNSCKTCGMYMGPHPADPTRQATHDAWHNSMGQTIEPPAPKWREMVEERREAPLASTSGDTSLGVVLYCLRLISRGELLKPMLARIIAIAEAEIGGGWQAEPQCWWADSSPDIESLLDALSETGADRWEKLGNLAAAWLRDLTDGGEA